MAHEDALPVFAQLFWNVIPVWRTCRRIPSIRVLACTRRKLAREYLAGLLSRCVLFDRPEPSGLLIESRVHFKDLLRRVLFTA